MLSAKIHWRQYLSREVTAIASEKTRIGPACINASCNEYISGPGAVQCRITRGRRGLAVTKDKAKVAACLSLSVTVEPVEWTYHTSSSPHDRHRFRMDDVGEVCDITIMQRLTG